MKEARIESVTVSTEHIFAMCDDGDLLIRFNVPSGTAGLCMEMSGRAISELADELYTIKARMSVLGIDGWKD